MGQVTFSDTEIEVLGESSAFVRGRWGLILPDGKKPGGLFTLIFRKLPGSGWKIVHDHTSSAPDEPVRRLRLGADASDGQAARMSDSVLPAPTLDPARHRLRPGAGDRPGLARPGRPRPLDGWALLMYLPMVPLGLAAMGFDAICRGRALPRGRFALGRSACSRGLIGPGRWWARAEVHGGRRPGNLGAALERALGGRQGPESGEAGSIRREILRQGADLIVLSEAPPADWLDQLVKELGPGASRVQIENEPRGRCTWFKLVVCSKGPLRLVRREPIADGAGMVVEAEVRGRTGPPVRWSSTQEQSPCSLAMPRLLDIADSCRRAREDGRADRRRRSATSTPCRGASASTPSRPRGTPSPPGHAGVGEGRSPRSCRSMISITSSFNARTRCSSAGSSPTSPRTIAGKWCGSGRATEARNWRRSPHLTTPPPPAPEPLPRPSARPGVGPGWRRSGGWRGGLRGGSRRALSGRGRGVAAP